MKRNTRIFLRSITVTFIILSFFIITAAGICEAYKGTRLIAYGEHTKAVRVTDDSIRILDFEIEKSP